MLSLAATFVGYGCAEDKEAVEVMEMEPPMPCTPDCGTGEEGHSCCRQAYGPRYFCDTAGACVQAEACTEERCCVPSAGENGDEYCVGLMGLGSACEIKDSGGLCSDAACQGCSVDSAGHGCCQETLGPTSDERAFVCSLGQSLDGDDALDGMWDEGRCIAISPCASDARANCCVPGPMGDSYCSDPENSFGDASYCAPTPGGMSALGICAQTVGLGMMSQPACDGCNPDNEGHSCCQDEYGPTFFCGYDGRCERGTACMADECCIPGPDGDAECAMRFNAESVCDIELDDQRRATGGRCSDSNSP